MTQRIRGIFFDLGETLLDFGDVDVDELFQVGSRLAYDYLDKLGQPLPPFERYNRMQRRAVKWRYLISRITRREFDALELIDGLARRLGQEITPDDALELAWRWYQPLSETATLEDDLRPALLALRREGLVLGVISNTFIPGKVLDRHLAQENLLDLLPTRIYSSAVRYRKPHRRIFQTALDRASLLAEETLFVGDSLRADIKGANRVGMISVLKDPTDRPRRSRIRPAHRIRRIAELLDIVKQYNGRDDEPAEPATEP